MSIKPPQQLFADLISKWGDSASNAIHDPNFQIFNLPTIEGMIGYRVELNCAIVLGEPVCPPDAFPSLATAFHDYCKEHGWSIIYLIVSKKFADWALSHGCKSFIKVGQELFLDPKNYPKSGSNGRLLHKKVKHADNLGVKVKEYLHQDKNIENAIEKAGEAWLKGRRGPQIYVSHIHLFNSYSGKRWFYALQNDQVVGVLMLNKLEAYQGWLLNFLLPTPQAPNGTSELLVISALDALANENCPYLSFGISAVSKLDELQGLSKLSIWIAKAVFNTVQLLFNLQGKRKYWEKFEPQCENSYAVFSEPHIRIRQALAILKTLNIFDT